MASTLTFGVELEFIAVFENRAFTNKIDGLQHIESDDYITAQEAICQCLKDHSILASRRPTYDSWHVHEDGLALSQAEQAACPSGLRVESIEISSRKLQYADNWQQEVRHVLNVLQWMRETFSCEFITNASTGLHVHIGDVSGISLRTAKRIVQIATVHERNLDEIHSIERVFPLIAAPLVDLDNDIEPPLYAGLSFAHISNDRADDHSYIIDFMPDIESAESLADLGSDLNRVMYQGQKLTGHNCTLNLDNLYQNRAPRAERGFTGTIEFRQHAGDLNATEIISYITLLATLTIYCTTASDASVLTLIAHGIDITQDLSDLLRRIGCEPSITQYFSDRTPRALTTASCAALQSFIDVNDQECAARRDPQAVAAAIQCKWKAGVYALDAECPVSIGVEFFEDEIDWMFQCARLEATESDPESSTEELDSRARRDVFDKFAELYALAIQPPYYSRIYLAKQVMEPWSKKYTGFKYDGVDAAKFVENVDEDEDGDEEDPMQE